MIIDVARKGNKLTQRKAITCLTEIAEGIGVEDLKNVNDDRWITLIAQEKSLAANTVMELAEIIPGDEKASTASKIYSGPRRLFTDHQLWLMGISQGGVARYVFYGLYNYIRSGFQTNFLAKIILTMLAVLRCPQLPGFNFGIGYANWVSDYSVPCFETRIRYFRTVTLRKV